MTESDATGRRIVVGIDGSSSSNDALRWAAHYAELTGCELELVAAWEFPTSFGWAPPYPADFNPEAEAQKVLEKTLHDVLGGSPAVKAKTATFEGHPAPVLVEASRGAKLLVVGSRGHGEFVGMLIGSVSEHCVANSHCPVLVMRSDGDPPVPGA